MSVRFPSVAGMFYPAREKDCREQVEKCLESVPPIEREGAVRGGVVPHAGWSYSGPTAGRVFAALSAEDPPETIVLFGAVHRWGVRGASMYGSGSWRTPLGDLSIDEELAQEVLRSAGGAILDNPDAHVGEHSIEVQLPFVAHLFPSARILPISVPPSPHAHKVGAQVASAARVLGRRTLAIGTSDLTHYGPRYGLAPVGVGDQTLEWVRKNDARLLDLTVQMRAADVVEEAREHQNACGAGAIAASIAYAAQLGATRGIVLHHTTSHDVMPMGPPTDMVGYAAIVFM
ncbi:MAG TPA: AmmeMemoRadiSam system protein B [Anaerolineae bacterium]|nr:AmmeMemoRadiSam system protein B [Anaerolineae bacterium]